MVRLRLPQRVVALSLVLVLAGCGGGGGSNSAAPSAPMPSSSVAPQGSGKLALSITVPTATTTAQSKKRAQFVSPATQSVAVKLSGVTTNIDLTSGSSGCSSQYTNASISEIPVGLEPRGLVIGSDHNVYFVEDAGRGIGKIASGDSYSDVSTGVYQDGLIVGADGYFWIADIYSDTIGHMSADRSSYATFGGMPLDQANLTLAPDGSVWFRTFTGSPSNAIYHVDALGNYVPGDTITTQFPVTDVTTGPDGAIWAAEHNGNTGRVARVAKVGGTWTLTNEFTLPDVVAKLLFSPVSGLLWLVTDAGGVYTMTTAGAVSTMPSLYGGPALQMSFASDGSLWFPETNVNRIAHMTSAGAVTEYTIPTASSDTWAAIVAPNGSVYFTERGTNKVGHMQFPLACSVTASVPAGNATATITTYDAIGGAGGSGHALSTQTLPVTVPLNTTTQLNFVLSGIVNAMVLTKSTTFSPGCSNSGSYPLMLTATDASGATIVGPGGYVDANGNALTFTLATSDTSGHSTFANGTITSPVSTAPTLNWASGPLNYQTITATASGGTYTGPAIAPVSVGNSC